MRNLDQDDPTFVEDLYASQRTVWRVARWLHTKGFDVTVRALNVRPSSEQRIEYGDDGDLQVIERVEVKHRDLNFTSGRDYPYATVLVDVAHTYDRARVKPKCYVILNQAETFAAIVHRSSRAHWRKVTKYDRHAKREREYYECPVAYVAFEPFLKAAS